MALRLAWNIAQRSARATGRSLAQQQPPAAVGWQPRLCAAVVLGVLATFFAYHQLTGRGWLASDFEYSLRAARRLLEGLNPYTDPTSRAGLPYPFDAQFPYPLFAALIAVPFTAFPSYVAGALFVGCTTALMVFGVTRDGWWRLSILASPSYFVVASVANWSPLLVAAAFLPLLQPLAITKPSTALPVILSYPSLRGMALMSVPLLISLLVLPSWPYYWVASALAQPAGKYAIPVLAGPTVMVLAAALWWRHRPARLLVMLACIPQHAFFYDQLLLWLIPENLRQSLALSAATWAGYVAWSLVDPGFQPLLAKTEQGPGLGWTAPLFYLPALTIVAWQIVAKRRTTRATMAASPVAASRLAA